MVQSRLVVEKLVKSSKPFYAELPEHRQDKAEQIHSSQITCTY